MRGVRRLSKGVNEESVVYSESLLSELEPLELLLPDSEEELLLRRDGPPDGAEPDFSAQEKRGQAPPVI